MFTPIVRLFQVSRLRFVAVLFGTTVCLLAGNASMRAKANPRMPAPIDAQVSLASNPSIMLGEPIVLRYKIANATDSQGVGIGLGTYNTQWCRLSLTDAEGQSAQVIPDNRPLNPSGLHSTGTSFLRPDGSQEDQLVVTRFFRVLRPGKYTLNVHVQIPYVATTITEESSLNSDLESDIKANNKVLTDDFVFPLTITQAVPSRLEAKANSLRQVAMAEKGGRNYKVSLDALFSMPEAQAASSWKSLANNANEMDAELVADHLARIHSVTTVNLLVQMLDNPKLSPDQTSYIRAKIDESYNAGDVTVKGHIKALAASRGGTMPETVPIPQPSD